MLLDKGFIQSSAIHSFSVPIHPLYSRIAKPGSWRQQVQEEDILLPSDTLQLLLKDPKTCPGQKGHIIPPASYEAAPLPPPNWMCLKKLQRKTRGHPNKLPEPPQLTSFNVSTLSSLWISYTCLIKFRGKGNLLQLPSGSRQGTPWTDSQSTTVHHLSSTSVKVPAL